MDIIAKQVNDIKRLENVRVFCLINSWSSVSRMVNICEMAGPPSQGWSKFATNYNSGSTSDPNGRPWTMSADKKAKLVEEQSLLDKETARIQNEKEKPWELEEEIVTKEKWIKKVEREIKTVVAAVNGQWHVFEARIYAENVPQQSCTLLLLHRERAEDGDGGALGAAAKKVEVGALGAAAKKVDVGGRPEKRGRWCRRQLLVGVLAEAAMELWSAASRRRRVRRKSIHLAGNRQSVVFETGYTR
ncbi:hypothetical protein LXL04_012361 [Taraxacum kok-saghyz]